ncbi:MAG: hypothetical protein ABW148_00960 [Sedimenticola sp.]
MQRPFVVVVTTRFKREQDIHFNNCKYCATGYLKLPGNDYSFKRADDFLTHYPNLARLKGFDGEARLLKVKEWDEYIWDSIEMEVAGVEIGGALVTRIHRTNGVWDESEFSFKVRADEQGEWNREMLQHLSDLYNRLYTEYADLFFVREPSIFTMENPVSSVAI